MIRELQEQVRRLRAELEEVARQRRPDGGPEAREGDVRERLERMRREIEEKAREARDRILGGPGRERERDEADRREDESGRSDRDADRRRERDDNGGGAGDERRERDRGDGAAFFPDGDRQVLRGQTYFGILDRNGDGRVNPNEWSVSRRLKPAFEEAGARLDEDMTQEDFVATYLRTGEP